MIPKKQFEDNGYESSGSETYNQSHTAAERGIIAVAQECTEASGWSHSSYTSKDVNATKCCQTEGVKLKESIKVDRGDFVRVKLSKIPSLDYKHQFFVRAAGGMSIPVPDIPQSPDMSVENSHQVTSPSVPQLEETSLTMNRYPDSTTSEISSKRTNSYLPLSVELVAGRSTTSIPADGSKNSSNTTKVRSVPPSKTLTMSASLLKSYLIPGSSTSSGSDKSQSKNMAATADAENSVKTKMMGIWNNVKY
ncbi:hypothetical protein SK128_015694, partial [Halocaridina rubra]